MTQIGFVATPVRIPKKMIRLMSLATDLEILTCCASREEGVRTRQFSIRSVGAKQILDVLIPHKVQAPTDRVTDDVRRQAAVKTL